MALEDFSNSSSVSPLTSRFSSRVAVAALRVCASWRPGVSQAGQPICAQSLLCTQQSCALPGPAGSPPAVLFPPALTPNAKAQVRRGPLTAQARKPPSQAGGSGRLGTDAVVCLRRCPKMVPSHARSWEGALRISAPSSWRPLLGKHCLGELTNRGHLSLAPPAGLSHELVHEADPLPRLGPPSRQCPGLVHRTQPVHVAAEGHERPHILHLETYPL